MLGGLIGHFRFLANGSKLSFGGSLIHIEDGRLQIPLLASACQNGINHAHVSFLEILGNHSHGFKAQIVTYQILKGLLLLLDVLMLLFQCNQLVEFILDDFGLLSRTKLNAIFYLRVVLVGQHTFLLRIYFIL